MARADWCSSEVYEFYDQWRRDCLVGDGALFTDGEIWTAGNLDQLQTTIGVEHRGSGSFIDKLQEQLEGHDPEVR
ncbi:MAG: hypothetical protein Q7T55_14550, partial [Solirubrobacteraceae bacterium]|nr:hypothetical protein [Solirubrobacteraceae bacterium]